MAKRCCRIYDFFIIDATAPRLLLNNLPVAIFMKRQLIL